MELRAKQSERGLQRLDRITSAAHVRILAANPDDLKWTLMARIAAAGLRLADKDTYRAFISMLVDQVKHAGGNNLPDTFKLHQAPLVLAKNKLRPAADRRYLGKKLFYRLARERVGIIHAGAAALPSPTLIQPDRRVITMGA